MWFKRAVLTLAAVAGFGLTAGLVTAEPAAAQHWRHRPPHHHFWPGFFIAPPIVVHRRRCWTEYRTVQVRTRHGWRWVERPTRVCR